MAIEAPVSGRRLLVLGAVFALALGAFLLLLAFTPARLMGAGEPGTADSRDATGFAGLGRLLPKSADRDPLESEELLVVVLPRFGFDAERMEQLAKARGGKPTLLVLPKWNVVADPLKPGWVKSNGVSPVPPVLPEALGLQVHTAGEPFEGGRLQGQDYMEGWQVSAPASGSQWLTGEGMTPLLQSADGKVVLAEIEAPSVLILADPDLLNNLSMAARARAGAAVGLINALNSTDSATANIVDADALMVEPNMLRLLFTPPFLAMTLVLLGLLLFGGWQALVRFGSPRQPAPTLLPGKAALVENAAGLLRMAGREVLAAPPYARLMARTAAEDAGIPPMDDARLWPLLDTLSNGQFTVLANEMQAAGRHDMLGAAQALHDWKEGMQR